MSAAYTNNKPLINSIFIGTFYFIFTWTVDFVEDIGKLYAMLMLFLPGVTFPLTTTYYRLKKEENTMRLMIHFALSVIIFHSMTWIFSLEGQIKFITLIAGFTGSLAYLVITLIVLKIKVSFREILFTTILSGLAFLPFELFDFELVMLGLAILLWTVINAYLLNMKYKHTFSPVLG